MSSTAPASEATKNEIENTVNWFLSDKLQDPATTIATKKYLTNDNVLYYLTRCNVAELSVPRIKVQIFERVDGGVRETDYLIFSDHRITKIVNEMIFGTNKAGTADGNKNEEVSEEEAARVVQDIKKLDQARQSL